MKTKMSLSNPEVKRIVKATYPGYRGRKVFFSDQVPKYELRSYWDGGSRTYYAFYQAVTGKVWHLGTNHPWFEKDKSAPLCDTMPDDVCLVAHSIFCGKDCGITIYARQPVTKEIK
jgi:hypothetical protein